MTSFFQAFDIWDWLALAMTASLLSRRCLRDAPALVAVHMVEMAEIAFSPAPLDWYQWHAIWTLNIAFDVISLCGMRRRAPLTMAVLPVGLYCIMKCIYESRYDLPWQFQRDALYELTRTYDHALSVLIMVLALYTRCRKEPYAQQPESSARRSDRSEAATPAPTASFDCLAAKQ